MENHYVYISLILGLTLFFLTAGTITGKMVIDIGNLEELFDGRDQVMMVQGTSCRSDTECSKLGPGVVCRRLITDDPEKYCEMPGTSGDMCSRSNDCVTGLCVSEICLGDCLVNEDCSSPKKCVLRRGSSFGDCK